MPEFDQSDGEVRRTAQRILAHHLRPGPVFWPDIELDFKDATLEYFAQSDGRGARFAGTEFLGEATFECAVSESDADFRGVDGASLAEPLSRASRSGSECRGIVGRSDTLTDVAGQELWSASWMPSWTPIVC